MELQPVEVMHILCMASFFVTMKPFKTYEEQIEIMRSRNLLPPLSKPKESQVPEFMVINRPCKVMIPVDLNQIREEALSGCDEYVKEILQTYGYYNVINQYNKPFLNKDGTYKPHIDFFKLFSLQQIDTIIKNVIFYPILQSEQRLKTCIAYEFARAYGPFEGQDMSQYLEPYFNEDNFNHSLCNRYKQPKFKQLIKRLMKIYDDSEYKPFKHYKDNHGHIPIWVFINKFTYGELQHFYDVLKIQANISSQFKLTPSQLRTAILFLSQVRNDCAHFSGFYNQQYPKIKKDIPLLLAFQTKFNFTNQSQISNLFLILIFFKYLLPKRNYSRLLKAVDREIFQILFDQCIPQISEYMKKKLSIKSKEDYKEKLEFLKKYELQ